MLGRPSLLAFRPSPIPGWAGQKVLWFALPAYTGPVLVRGRRLDGPGQMRFEAGRGSTAELRWSPGETVGWTGQVARSRGLPSGVLVRTPGCYAVQIDGTSFSRVVVFPVSIER
jgi:hypothetical protein